MISVLQAGRLMKQMILKGELGDSGTRFPGIRDWADRLGCSYMTAMKAAEWVREQSLLMLNGKYYYVVTGRAAHDSELEIKLSARRHGCFGIMVSSLENPYISKTTHALANALTQQEYQAMIMVHDADRQTESAQLDKMLELNMSGVFFFPHYSFQNKQIFECFPLPVVALGRRVKQFTRNTVTVNNLAVGRLAAEHLLEQGYDEYIYIGFRQERFMTDQRLQGFQQALEAAGQSLSAENILLVNGNDVEEILNMLQGLIARSQGTKGIFCYHDLLAYETLKFCKAEGVLVPQHVGLIGCDDLPITLSTTPTLTTIHYPYGRLSKMAVELMIEELDTCICRSRCMEAMPRVIPRQSTGAP